MLVFTRLACVFGVNITVNCSGEESRDRCRDSIDVVMFSDENTLEEEGNNTTTSANLQIIAFAVSSILRILSVAHIDVHEKAIHTGMQLVRCKQHRGHRN